MMWALAEVWRDLFDRRHPPWLALKKAAALLDEGDAERALGVFKRAATISAAHGDLSALGAAWHGIAAARAALGDMAGAEAAEATAIDADRQINPH